MELSKTFRMFLANDALLEKASRRSLARSLGQAESCGIEPCHLKRPGKDSGT
jgi:hypothetical protein